MTIKLSLLVTANNKQAKQAFSDLQRDFSAVTGSAKQLETATRSLPSNLSGISAPLLSTAASALQVEKAFQLATKGAGDLTANFSNVNKGFKSTGASAGALLSSFRPLRSNLDEVINRMKEAMLAARQMGQQHRIAAGSVANLMAQFNDIGVMMAAGQNPLQLAIQQGSQITQVLGPMGARGAVVALRSAFVSMINPMSLLTLGVIAGGAALVQWAAGALSAGENATKFQEALEGLEAQTEAAQDKVDLLKSGMRSLGELRLSEQIADLKLQRDVAAAQANEEVESSVYAARVDALNREIATLEAILATHQKTNSELDQEQTRQQTILRTAKEYFEVRQRQEARVASEAQRGQSLIDQLAAQADLQQVIAVHGADSVEAATARVQAERDAFIQQELSADMAETLKQAILAAWDAANGVASVDMSGNITLAADEAARLRNNLLAARGAQIVAASKANPDFFDPRNESGLAGEVDRNKYSGALYSAGPVALPRNPRSTGSRRRGRGGGGSAARSQINAADRLLQRYQRELDILRETDPVQKEMIRNRVALATASDSERTRIEGLIRQRHEETRAMERQKQIWDDVESAGRNALDTLIRRGGNLKDVLAELAVDLLEVILRGERLNSIGTGGGGGLFGGGGGGLFGGFFANLFGGKRERGGPVQAGRAYLVGEKRAELFVPNTSGRIIPEVGSASGGGRSGVHYEQHIHAAGNEEVRRIARDAAQQVLGAFNSEVLPRRVAEIQENPRRVG